VRRILSVLLEALGRPIGHNCWVDPIMRGSGNALGGEKGECLPKHRGSAQLGSTVVGKDGVSAPRHSRAGAGGIHARDHRMPIGVIVEPSIRETFTLRELVDAYKKFLELGPQYLDAETGIEGSVYRFGTRVLVIYEEPETKVIVLIHPTS
jgi:hypothetical protein